MLFIARRKESRRPARGRSLRPPALRSSSRERRSSNFNVARGFGEDGEGERIPFGKDLAVGDVFAALARGGARRKQRW